MLHAAELLSTNTPKIGNNLRAWTNLTQRLRMQKHCSALDQRPSVQAPVGAAAAPCLHARSARYERHNNNKLISGPGTITAQESKHGTQHLAFVVLLLYPILERTSRAVAQTRKRGSKKIQQKLIPTSIEKSQKLQKRNSTCYESIPKKSSPGINLNSGKNSNRRQERVFLPNLLGS